MEFLAKGVLLIGIFLLLGALLPIGFLIIQIRDAETRIKWITLACFILLAIIGYFLYTIEGIHSSGYVGLLIPLVFFLGSSFVWLVTMVSLQTANNVRRITCLDEQIFIDSLMGIYNRRFFDKRIIEEMTRAERYNLPLSVFMIDIDHFKSINDKYGHKTGDVVLKNIGKLMLQASRSSDIVARYGGDEICFVATNTKSQDAKYVAERLCKLIDSTPLITPVELPRKADVPHITGKYWRCQSYGNTRGKSLYC
jgi:diguanylate cyclase (GGDEF)-like protein